MEKPKPSTSQSASLNQNRPSTSRGLTREDEVRVKLERSDSFDEIVELEDNSILSEEFARMEADRRKANQRRIEQDSSQQTSPNQRVPNEEIARNNQQFRTSRENHRNNRRRSTSPRRNRRRSPTPSDPSHTDSDEEYVPYFSDPVREADRLRQERARRRAKRTDQQRRGVDQQEAHRRERRDRRRERDVRTERRDRSRENLGPPERRIEMRDERRNDRRNENPDRPNQPQIIQIMIPISEAAMMHGLPLPYGFRPPPRGPMFHPMMSQSFDRFAPPRHMNRSIYPPHYGVRFPPPPMYSNRFPPNRFRGNRPAPQ